jgi:hypothetical protein
MDEIWLLHYGLNLETWSKSMVAYESQLTYLMHQM